MEICTKEKFLKDVQNHEMTIVLDQGLHRHIRFQVKNSITMHFDLVTWPGYLCISGDMGTYVFQRIPDMFQFFTGEDINPHYWSEKVQAEDKQCKIVDFDQNKFKTEIMERLDEISDWEEWTWDFKEEVIEEIELLFQHYDGAGDLLKYMLHEFEYEDFQFGSEDIPDGKTLSYHFVWCCRAIQWGIQKYQNSKAGIDNK